MECRWWRIRSWSMRRHGGGLLLANGRGVEEEEEEEEVVFEVWREVRCPQDPSFGNFELSPV